MYALCARVISTRHHEYTHAYTHTDATTPASPPTCPRHRWRGAEKAPPPTATRRAFATGALLNLLNPKAYLFFVVVAPEFMGGRTLGLSEALTLAVISTGIATIIPLAIVLAGSQAQAWLADDRRTRWVRRGFAVVMLGVAASFLAIKAG